MGRKICRRVQKQPLKLRAVQASLRKAVDMRAAVVIVLSLMISTTALAQVRGGTHGPVGGRGPIGPGPGIGGPGTVDVPEIPQVPDTRDLELPQIDRSLSTPSAGGGGGGPSEHVHSGHAHPHCHDEWVCGPDRYETTDGNPVGSEVPGVWSGGRWVQGPCHKDRRC